jgi:hypothetical protein
MLSTVSSMPLKGTSEARGKPPSRQAWLRDRMVRSREADLHLRGKSPLSLYLGRWGDTVWLCVLSLPINRYHLVIAKLVTTSWVIVAYGAEEEKTFSPMKSFTSVEQIRGYTKNYPFLFIQTSFALLIGPDSAACLDMRGRYAATSYASQWV